MKHWHHIIPRHMGGSNDPSNLIELTVEEHAEAHRVLYELYGKQEDYLAWRGLSGRISKEQVIRERCSIGGRNAAKSRRKLGLPIGAQRFDRSARIANSRKAGKMSTNANAKWWFNGSEYKFTLEQPEGYEKSAAPNNPGKKTGGTLWWNDGTNHRRSSSCPGDGWIEGRINRGNLGGSRKAS